MIAPPKQAACILKEKYRQQRDQQTEGTENEIDYASDKIEEAGRRVTNEVKNYTPKARRSEKQNPFKQRETLPKPKEGIKAQAEKSYFRTRPADLSKTREAKEQARPHQPSPGIPRQRSAPTSVTPGKETTSPSGLTRPQEAGRQTFISRQRSRPKGQLPTTSGGNATTEPINAKGRPSALKERPRTILKSKSSQLSKDPKPSPKVKLTAKAAKTMRQTVQRRMRQQMVTRAKQAAKATANIGKKAAIVVAKAVASLVSSLMGLLGGGILLVILIFVVAIAAIANSPFGLFFSGEQPGPGAISPGEAVAQLNAEYAARLETLKAGSYDGIEMSGKPADWRDILAVFAVQTAGADNGVDVATLDADRVARLRAVYWDMTTITSWVEVIDHDDSDPDDEVDDSWTEYILHITVTGQTAGEAADSYGFNTDQKTLLAELQAPENNDLWLALLYGASDTDSQIVAVALSQLGNVGGDPYWSWYGFDSRVDWCACFVSWCANECGYIDAGVFPKFASCSDGVAWFREQGLWQDNSYEPCPGDIVFFDWNNESTGQDGSPDHVGIVENVEDSIIYTIEGNSNNSCRKQQYVVGNHEIYGYGILIIP